MIKLACEFDEVFEWRKWTDKIPFIQWPSDWLVKSIASFGGAIIRYHITKSGLDDYVSVYLDCYELLGLFGEPYWEVYPNINGDVARCSMNDINKLMDYISASLNYLEGREYERD